MIRKAVLIILVARILTGCDKGNFNTVPSLKVKSINGDIIPRSVPLVVDFDFTDKEGDVDSIFVIRQRLNSRAPIQPAIGKYRLPSGTPELNKGVLRFTADYSIDLTAGIPEIILQNNPRIVDRDTLRIRFFVQDKAKNKSDTADVNVIVIR